MFDGKAFGEKVVETLKSHINGLIDPILKRIEAVEKREPINGKDGRDGVDGKDASPITREQIMDAVRAMPDVFAEAVKEYLAANPPAPGKDGCDGIDGKDGANGRDGVDGKDGISLAGAMVDREGQLIVTLSNGEHKPLGVVVGKDGKDGRNGVDGAPGEKGRDGFSLKDFDAEMLPDGQTILLKFGSGDILETHELCFPVVVDRGVWREGSYTKGSGVSFGGSFWIAQEDTTDKPETSKAWRLAVKRGRDGKEVVTLKPRKDEPVKA